MEFTGAIPVSISSSTRLGLNSPICSWFIGKPSSLLSRSSAFLDGIFLIKTVQFLSLTVRQALTTCTTALTTCTTALKPPRCIDTIWPGRVNCKRENHMASDGAGNKICLRKRRFMHFNEIPFLDVKILKWTSSKRLELVSLCFNVYRIVNEGWLMLARCLLCNTQLCNIAAPHMDTD